MPPQWIIRALWLESFIFMASTWPLLALKAFATVGERWQKTNPSRRRMTLT